MNVRIDGHGPESTPRDRAYSRVDSMEAVTEDGGFEPGDMNEPKRPLVMTTTNELFLPARIVYRVADRARVLATFRGLRCMTPEPSGRWTWNYEFEAKAMGFPQAYEEVSPERQPVVLAACYWVGSDGLHVYVRSTLRLTKFLVFFDQQVPRTCALGEFFDEYNFLTVQDPRLPLPKPEDFFRDDSKLVFSEWESRFWDASSVEELVRSVAERTLEPLERHRLTAFYEDGPEHMVRAMRLREILAMEQHRSAKPIRPFEVLQRALEGSGGIPAATPKSKDSRPIMPTPNLPSDATELPASAGMGSGGFSFLKWDPALGRELYEVISSSGALERYVVAFGCCENPACDCRVLELWLRPWSDSGSSGPTRHLRLDIEARRVGCGLPTEDSDRRLGEGLASRITAEDWELAAQVYRSDKADHSEPENAGDLEAAFPEEVLADPSVMMQYQEVFPHARTISFEKAGSAWAVLERYCTRPDCSCQEVYLDIAKVPGNIARQPKVVVKEKDLASVSFDYTTGSIKVRKTAPRGWPSELDLFAALQAANPELKVRLKRRQRVLRQLHRNARRAHKLRTAAQAPQPPKKVGRNEPCPCGSGKKFKHCCGR